MSEPKSLVPMLFLLGAMAASPASGCAGNSRSYGEESALAGMTNQSGGMTGNMGAGGTPGAGGGTGGSSPSPGGNSSVGGSDATGGNLGTGGGDATGGNLGTGGSDATGGDLGTGGTGTGGMGTGGAAGDTCNGAPDTVIDNFATCDPYICNLGGRRGDWYWYKDTNIQQYYGVGIPGESWVQQCGAYTHGGPNAETGVAYAGMGLVLNSGNPYDLSSYLGLSVSLESNHGVWVNVKTQYGGLFGTWLTQTGASGVQVYNVNFSNFAPMNGSAETTLNLGQVIEIQFSPASTSGFGFSVHGLLLR